MLCYPKVLTANANQRNIIYYGLISNQMEIRTSLSYVKHESIIKFTWNLKTHLTQISATIRAVKMTDSILAQRPSDNVPIPYFRSN